MTGIAILIGNMDHVNITHYKYYKNEIQLPDTIFTRRIRNWVINRDVIEAGCVYVATADSR